MTVLFAWTAPAGGAPAPDGYETGSASEKDLEPPPAPAVAATDPTTVASDVPAALIARVQGSLAGKRVAHLNAEADEDTRVANGGEEGPLVL